MDRELDEHSRAFTTAMVDTLQLRAASDVDARDRLSALALELARQDQRIEGLPLKPIHIPEIAETTNSNALAGGDLEARRRQIDALLERRREVEERLLELAAQFETERNRASARHWREGGIQSASVLSVLGLVLLGLCVPATIPIVGRLLALLVNRVPALAGISGVVSVEAFDAIVKAIERTKREIRVANQSGSFPPIAGAVEIDGLHDHLSREMDAAHKRLVQRRKSTFHHPEAL